MITSRNMRSGYSAAKLCTDTWTSSPGVRVGWALQQYVGPSTLRIQRGNGKVFEVSNLPGHLRIHKTYNVSAFKRYSIDESRHQEPPHAIRVSKSREVEHWLEAISEWR
jgi:hypothetical protein